MTTQKEIIRDGITRRLRRSTRPLTCTDLMPHLPTARDHMEVSLYLSRMYSDGLLRRFPAGPGYRKIRFAYLLAEAAPLAVIEEAEAAAPQLTLPDLPAAAQTARPRIHVRGNPEAMTITDQGHAVVIGLPGFEVTVEAA